MIQKNTEKRQCLPPSIDAWIIVDKENKPAFKDPIFFGKEFHKSLPILEKGFEKLLTLKKCKITWNV